MGQGRIYNFRLALDEKNRGLFPEILGKAGRSRLAAIDARLRALIEPLGGVILALSVSQRGIRLAWQAGDEQAEVLRKIEAMLSGENCADGRLLLELFLSDEPKNPEMLYALGTAYCDENDLERALELLARLVEAAPEHVNGRVAKGAVLLRMGKIAEAVSELERAVRQNPENLWAHRTLGAGLMLLNRYSEAAANLRLAREIDSDDQQAWLDYAKALDGREAIEQAESAYLKTIEIDEFSQAAEEARQRLGEKKFHH